MTKVRLTGTLAAAAFAGLAIAGLAGWAVLLVLAMMILLGTVILATELARPVINARRQVASERRAGD